MSCVPGDRTNLQNFLTSRMMSMLFSSPGPALVTCVRRRDLGRAWTRGRALPIDSDCIFHARIRSASQRSVDSDGQAGPLRKEGRGTVRRARGSAQQRTCVAKVPSLHPASASKSPGRRLWGAVAAAGSIISSSRTLLRPFAACCGAPTKTTLLSPLLPRRAAGGLKGRTAGGERARGGGRRQECLRAGG